MGTLKGFPNPPAPGSGRQRRVPPTASNQAQTPVELGYRMPAEWEPHAATFLSWPLERADWPGKLAPIARRFIDPTDQ